MLLRGASKHVVLTCLAFILATTLFSVPLVLRYHVYRDVTFRMTSGDSADVDKHVSTVWCSAQHLESQNKSNISAFLFNEPPVLSGETMTSVYREHVELKAGTSQYWQVKLLEGSSLTVSACAKLSGATVTFIKSRHVFAECIREYQEESVESLESSEGSDSSSFSNETDVKEFECDEAMSHRKIPQSLNCSKTQHPLNSSESMAFKLSSSDQYFIVFSRPDYVPLVDDEVFVDFQLDRPLYDVSGAQSNCSGQQECEFAFSVGQEPYIIVQMGSNEDGRQQHRLSNDVLVATCLPRKGLYFLFYLLFFIVLFICAFQ